MIWKKLRRKPEEEMPLESEAVLPMQMQESAHHLPELSRDSAVWRLWERCYAAQEELPQPLFELETLLLGEALPLSQTELEREGAAMLTKLEQFAAARLKELEPREDGAEPEAPCAYFVHVSANELAAWVMIFPASGQGAGLSPAKLGEALQNAGVHAGVIDSALVRLLSGGGRFFELCPVARGIPAEEGTNGKILEKYERQNVRKVQIDGQGNIDYRTETYVQAIQQGETICEILPAVPGISGLLVSGKTAQPTPVYPATLPKGTNTEVSEDGGLLLASMSGHLEFQGGKFHVRPALVISGDVDYSVGNIDYPGDVHIRGDVRENFFVRAKGKITIDGLVEGAAVEAGGDVVISKGVLGNEKAVIRSKGLVRAKFLENCTVYSADCTYADCIIACRIYSDKKISVMTGRGTVIGGLLVAAESVECLCLGSKADRETQIILGQRPCARQELQKIPESLKAMEKEREELGRTMAYLEERAANGGRTSDEEQKFSDAKLRVSILALKADRLTKRRQELQADQTDLALCRLSCGTAYPTTKITIGSDSRVLEEVWQKCNAYYSMEDREIRFS